MKVVQPIIASNGGSLPPNDAGRIAQYFREEEGGKSGKCVESQNVKNTIGKPELSTT